MRGESKRVLVTKKKEREIEQFRAPGTFVVGVKG